MGLGKYCLPVFPWLSHVSFVAVTRFVFIASIIYFSNYCLIYTGYVTMDLMVYIGPTKDSFSHPTLDSGQGLMTTLIPTPGRLPTHNPLEVHWDAGISVHLLSNVVHNVLVKHDLTCDMTAHFR